MLNDEIEKKIKKEKNNYLSQLELICQIRNLGQAIRIAL
jgi:hypothetical protein